MLIALLVVSSFFFVYEGTVIPCRSTKIEGRTSEQYARAHKKETGGEKKKNEANGNRINFPPSMTLREETRADIDILFLRRLSTKERQPYRILSGMGDSPLGLPAVAAFDW